MNAYTADSLQALPVLMRSEAFAEDVLEFVERAEPVREPASSWWVTLTPLAVAMVGLAFAVVPPLTQ